MTNATDRTTAGLVYAVDWINEGAPLTVEQMKASLERKHRIDILSTLLSTYSCRDRILGRKQYHTHTRLTITRFKFKER